MPIEKIQANDYNPNSVAPPEMELLDNEAKKPSYTLYPVYHSTEKLHNVGLHSKGISKLMSQLLLILKNNITENLSVKILHNHNLLNRQVACAEIHFPSNLIQKMN